MAYNNIYYLTVSEDWEFGSSLIGWFWLQDTHGVSEMLTGTTVILTGPEDLIPKYFPHMVSGSSLLADGRRPQSLAAWSSSQGRFRVLRTRQLASPGARMQTGQGRSHNVFYSLASEVTFPLFITSTVSYWFT